MAHDLGFSEGRLQRNAREKSRPSGLGRKARPLASGLSSPGFGVQTRTGCLQFRLGRLGRAVKSKPKQSAVS